MKHWTVRDGNGCEVFISGDNGSFDDLLLSIAEWWRGVVDVGKNIGVVQFTVNADGTKQAVVYWNYLTREQNKRLTELASEPQPLPKMKTEHISGN